MRKVHRDLMTVRTVVLRPEREVSPPDNILEYKPNNDPRHKIDRSGWWQ